MKRIILQLIFILSFLASASGILKERVILQTDKDFYLSGENLLFSLTTTDESQRPLHFSKVAYIELLSEIQPEVQVMIPVAKSNGHGQLAIPENLPTGYYRLVAYTGFMRNEGAAVFARKLVAVVNPMTLDAGNISLGNTYKISNNYAGEILFVTDKKNYKKRTPGRIEIEGLPATIKNISVSISGHMAFQIPEDTLKLSSENQPDKKYIAEYEGHIIRGKLVTEKDKPFNKNELSIYLSSPGIGPMIYRGKIDEAGNLSFITENLSLSEDIVTVISTKNSQKFVVDLLSPFAGGPLAALPVLEIDSALLGDIQQRNVALQVQKAFQQDSIPAKQAKHFSILPEPYKSFRLDEYTRFPTMEEVIIEFVSNVRFRKLDKMRRLAVISPELGEYTMGNSLVLLDNIPVFDHELLLQYNPLLIEKIDVYPGKYVFGSSFFDGIVSFTTYKRDFSGFTLDATTTITSYPEMEAGKAFSAPDYNDGKKAPSNIPDLRHTLLWIPEMKTEGRKTLSIPFSTSSYPGKFDVTITGISTDGQILTGKTTIEVE